MRSYNELSKEELLQEKESLQAAYKKYQEMDLSLNMARGKPAPAQLDLAKEMLTAVNPEEMVDAISGIDTRNYGGLDGIPGAKELIASMVDADPNQVIVFGNSSLNIMFDQVTRGMITGYCGNTPWCKLPEVKWICPVPGYDRHFGVTEHYGIKMINVPMTPDGPDMDMVEELVKDPAVKGMWNVPKYSNPQGYVYSDETVRRIAALKPAADDFRVFWDNAYCIHHLVENPKKPLTINQACEESGNTDIFYQFVSTSKVTFPGAGVAAFNTSKTNLDELSKSLGIQTIGFDKLNQLRHVRFFGNADKMRAHMEKHRAVLKPKFDIVLDMLEQEIAPLGIASWTKPEGGYFISFNAPKGTAKRIVQLCKEGGVTLTGAGATYPYKNDPDDSNIRIAPTYPKCEELTQAMELFCICVKLAALEQLTK